MRNDHLRLQNLRNILQSRTRKMPRLRNQSAKESAHDKWTIPETVLLGSRSLHRLVWLSNMQSSSKTKIDGGEAVTEVIVSQLRLSMGRQGRHRVCDCGVPISHGAKNCHTCANILKEAERRKLSVVDGRE